MPSSSTRLQCSMEYHPRAHRHLDRLRAVGVRGDLAAPERGLVHRGLHLLLRVLRTPDALLLGQHARAGEDLDPVRAVLDIGRGCILRISSGPSAMNGATLAMLRYGREAVEVAVAAGGRERRAAAEHPGADDGCRRLMARRSDMIDIFQGDPTSRTVVNPGLQRAPGVDGRARPLASTGERRKVFS